MVDQETPTAKPGRFALWELFVLMSLIAITGGCYSIWLDGYDDCFAAILFFAIVSGGFAIYLFTRSLFFVFGILPGILTLFFIDSMFSLGPHPVRRMQCSSNLKQIGLALQNYHDVYGKLPPAYIADASGKPIHSWRVLILPFMEHKPLYDKYRFDEPWDGPNNRKLHRELVIPYVCPSQYHRRRPTTETSYVSVIGPKTAWPGDKSTTVAQMTDGTSNTILVVEMANSGIHWMEPRDLDMATMPRTINTFKAAGISSAHPNVALAVFADGHTAPLTNNTPANTLEALLTIAGGEAIDPDF